jgi:hypothetical protein
MAEDTHPPALVQIFPEWTMSSLDPRLAGFDVVVKLAPHRALAASSLQILFLDQQQRVVDINTTPLALEGKEPRIGPRWDVLRARPVTVGADVVAVSAEVAGVRSEPVSRGGVTSPFTLRPVHGVLGLAREPHLWWRFQNIRAAVVGVDQLFAAAILEIDGRELPVPPGTYNGPAWLAGGAALSGFWSLEDFSVDATGGTHRLRAGMLGEWSDPFTFAWTRLA